MSDAALAVGYKLLLYIGKVPKSETIKSERTSKQAANL